MLSGLEEAQRQYVRDILRKNQQGLYVATTIQIVYVPKACPKPQAR